MYVNDVTFMYVQNTRNCYVFSSSNTFPQCSDLSLSIVMVSICEEHMYVNVYRAGRPPFSGLIQSDALTGCIRPSRTFWEIVCTTVVPCFDPQVPPAFNS